MFYIHCKYFYIIDNGEKMEYYNSVENEMDNQNLQLELQNGILK